MNSRNLQNLMHLTAGMADLLLLLSGISFGAQKWLVGIFFGATFFISKRITSEIFYRILVQVEKEGKNEKKI